MGIVLMLAVLTAAFFLAGLPFWGWFFVGLSVLLGAFELYSVARTGKTLTAQFMELSRRRPYVAGILATLLGASVAYLIAHLLLGI